MHVRTIISEEGWRYVLGVRRPFNAQHFAMMPRVSTMKVEGSEFSDKMIGRAPDLDVRVMRHCNISRDRLSLNKGQ